MANTTQPNMVIGGSTSHKSKAITWLVLAIVLIIAGVMLWLMYNRSSSNLTPKTTTAKQLKLPTVAGGLTANQKALYYADNGAYTQAQQVWQSQLVGASEATKLSIYYQQSALALSYKNYPDAQKYALEAKALDPQSPTAYEALAQLETVEGNKQLAIADWQTAIKDLSPSQLGYNLILQEYQSNLDSLK